MRSSVQTGSARPMLLVAGVATALLALIALVRPIDHDESQYVAAAMLAWHGLPIRDFAYLQTPLQPLLFAPLVALAGDFGWPVARLLNAALGAGILALSYAAMRASDAAVRPALAATVLLAATDVLLFSVATARNDALPACLLAAGLLGAIHTARTGGSRSLSLLVGLALAGAAAAKVSYAIPAAAYGVYALIDRRHRPFALFCGALPACILVSMIAWSAPQAFWFDVIRFPMDAPAQYYRAIDRADKLSAATKLLDLAKFLSLGAALPALLWVAWRRPTGPVARVCWVFLVAGLAAAVAPTPVWRQYLLPALPPLFVLLARSWTAHPPGRNWRIATIVFAVAGLAPTLHSLGAGRPAIAEGMRESAALRVAMDRAGVTGPVATLAPQFLPATGRPVDPYWATGPFFFRSSGLLSPAEERAFVLVSRATLAEWLRDPAVRPAAILVGGEGAWTAGNAALDDALERGARAAGWRQVPVNSARMRLYVPPARAGGSASRSAIIPE